MALTVEDGTGLSSADSYTSLADAESYIENYKGVNSAWDAASDSEKEVAARVATAYLDGLYDWDGSVGSSAQALGWPRNYAYDELMASILGVPQAVVNATAEVMFLQIRGVSLLVNEGVNPEVKIKSLDGVGSKTFFKSSQTQPIFPTINRMLSGLYNSGGSIKRS